MVRNEDLYSRLEAGRCLLCNDAPCGRVCGKADPASVIRSLRFDDAEGAGSGIPDPRMCLDCVDRKCLKVCNRGKVDRPVDIPSVITRVAERYGTGIPDGLPSTEVGFCGFRCPNPFVLGSSVVTSSYDMCRRALEAGWGGVSVKTICYIDIEEVSPRFDVPDRREHPFTGFRNMEQLSPNTPEFDFGWLARLKAEFPDRLVIASIMGRNEGEWEELSRMAREAGADVIECNFSCPQMVGRNLGSDIGQDPDKVERYTRACTRGADIPVIAKLTPNIERADGFVEAAYRGGAAGIAGINTVKSLTAVDFSGDGAERGVCGKTAVSGLSGKAVKPIALRFVREIRDSAYRATGNARPEISGIGGVETWRDAADFMLMGASTVQVCTAVMQYGYRIIDDLVLGLRLYMRRRGISDLDCLVGSGLPDVVEPRDLVRGLVVHPVFIKERCVSCGRCYVSCRDGGHQAIELVGRRPVLIEERCVGCHLCRLVCPAGAVGIRDGI